jgi:hypothetical protein
MSQFVISGVNQYVPGGQKSHEKDSQTSQGKDAIPFNFSERRSLIPSLGETEAFILPTIIRPEALAGFGVTAILPSYRNDF